MGVGVPCGCSHGDKRDQSSPGPEIFLSSEFAASKFHAVSLSTIDTVRFHMFGPSVRFVLWGRLALLLFGLTFSMTDIPLESTMHIDAKQWPNFDRLIPQFSDVLS